MTAHRHGDRIVRIIVGIGCAVIALSWLIGVVR